MPWSRQADSCGKNMHFFFFFSYFKKVPSYFSKWLYHGMFPGVMEEHSSGSTSLSTLDVVGLVNLRCVKGSRFGLICVTC